MQHVFSLPVLSSLLALLAAPAAAAQVYSYDDGVTESGLNIPGSAELGFMHAYRTTGAADILSQIDVSIGSGLLTNNGLDGRMTRVCVWDDLNNDGDPSDAVLLYESAPFPAAMTNMDVKMNVPLTAPVTVMGGFFVGALVEVNPMEFAIGLDDDQSPSSANAFYLSDTTSIDAANLGASTNRPTRVVIAVFLLDAVGSSPGGAGIINYCTAAPNSTGAAARITAIGSTFVSTNDLTLTAADLPRNQFGIFVVSMLRDFVPGANGQSNGNLCLGGLVGRFNRQGQILASGSTGQFSLLLDLNRIPQGGAFIPILGGETWNFQGWFRDGVGAGSNFTDGVGVTFL